jgi:methyl-CpG-binding domain protein 4
MGEEKCGTITDMREDLMVQQQVKNKWQHMVGVICLNQTYRKQTKRVLSELFKRYPNAKSYLKGRLSAQQKLLKPLGMWRVRSERLRKMSEQFLTWDGEDASDLYGIGKYGSDSYRIFYKNEIPTDVQDKELKKYIESL